MKTRIPEYLKAVFDKYKYILLLGLVGLLLMTWPENTQQNADAKVEQQTIQQEALSELERKLALLLSQMEGVGEASVLLTLEQGERLEYVFDRSDSRTESGGSVQMELVTLSQSGGQVPVLLQTESPVFRGAAVVCQGGESAAVRLLVTQTIQSLTGLSADRIVITKMK